MSTMQYIAALINVISLLVQNFRKKSASAINSLGVPYDYNSIMHYRSNAFAIESNLITIQSLTPGITVGRGECVSPLDDIQINKLYSCRKFPSISTLIFPMSLIAKSPPPLNVNLSALATKPDDIVLPYPCGQVYYANSTKTISVSHDHRPNVDCQYYIKRDPGYELDLSFTTSIEYSGGGSCPKDYLIVSLDHYNYGPYCSTNNLRFTQKLRHDVTLRYHTDSSDSYNGGFTGFTATIHVSS